VFSEIITHYSENNRQRLIHHVRKIQGFFVLQELLIVITTLVETVKKIAHHNLLFLFANIIICLDVLLFMFRDSAVNYLSSEWEVHDRILT